MPPHLSGVVASYTDALFDGDAAGARAFLSKRCTSLIAEPEWTAMVAQAHATYSGARVQSYDDDASQLGLEATAEYQAGPPSLYRSERWVRVGQRWYTDDCTPLP